MQGMLHISVSKLYVHTLLILCPSLLPFLRISLSRRFPFSSCSILFTHSISPPPTSLSSGSFSFLVNWTLFRVSSPAAAGGTAVVWKGAPDGRPGDTRATWLTRWMDGRTDGWHAPACFSSAPGTFYLGASSPLAAICTRASRRWQRVAHFVIYIWRNEYKWNARVRNNGRLFASVLL
jgi:hypothetical protein